MASMTAVASPRQAMPASLLNQSISMVLSTGINTGFGMVFWIIAARAYTSSDVGLASAAVSGLSLLLGVGQLGLPLALPRILPAARDGARDLVSTTYLAAIAVSLASGFLFVLVARRVDGLAALFQSLPFSIWFVLAVPCCVIFAVQDFVLCGLHRARWTPPENLAYSAGRFLLLGAFVGLGARGLVLAWTVPAAAAALVITWMLFRLALPAPAGSPRRGPVATRRLPARMISSDYVGSLAQIAAVRVLPLLIVVAIDERHSAYFYVAWTVVFAVDTVLANVVTAATVDGATDRGRMARHVHGMVRRGTALTGVAVVGVVVLAAPLLTVFSPEYAAATHCLQLLALSLVPRFALLLMMATARHDHLPGRIVVLQVVPAVLTVLGAVIGLQLAGITGVAAGYVVAQSTAAIACSRWLREWLSNPAAVNGARA
jgi:O-antigen/teichoic acid export membrane protein